MHTLDGLDSPDSRIILDLLCPFLLEFDRFGLAWGVLICIVSCGDHWNGFGSSAAGIEDRGVFTGLIWLPEISCKTDPPLGGRSDVASCPKVALRM